MRPILNLALKFIFCLMMAMPVGRALAQLKMPETDDDRLNQVKGLAKGALRMGDTYTALFYYQEWAQRKPESAEVAHQLAELYRATRNYPMADSTYLRVLVLAKDRYPDDMFYRAQMQMSQGLYVEAKKTFEQFRKLSKTADDKTLGKRALLMLKGCDDALDQKDSTAKAVATLLDASINWAHIEFSPVLLSDSVMVYGSLRDAQVNFYDATEVDSAHIPMRKLYKAVRKGDDWKSVGEMPGPWTEAQGHIGGAALSPDGERLYYTICNKNWKGQVICRIVYSERNGKEWTGPIDLGDEVNNGTTATQPSVGRASKTNAEVVYFVSDRPEGKGGTDIWFTEYYPKKKEFRAPKNVGPAVNTAGNELTPHYDMAAHALFYSSDGLPGMGGLDIFRIEGERNKWSKDSVSHLPKNINSPADDLWYANSSDHKGGFLVSNRTGGVALLHSTCCDDIYRLDMIDHIQIKAQGPITNCDTKECLTGATASVYITDPDGGDDFLVTNFQVNGCKLDIELQPLKDYRIDVVKDGYFNSSVTVSTRGIRQSDTLEVNACLKLIPTEPIRLDGIRYGFDSADLTPEAKTAIDTGLLVILSRNPDIIIELSSHTDSRGKDEYNLKLSERRAESVVKYCIAQGVDKRRLVAKGYGETKPVATNENPDGTDNPDGRAINRRTEFRILGRLGRVEE